MSGLDACIAARMAEEGDATLELALLGSERADEIAGCFRGWAESQLGTKIAGARFYRASVGCVAGVDLDDGRTAVIKVHPSFQRAGYLQALHEVRHRLAAEGFPCPRPLAPPARLEGAPTAPWVTAEAWLDEGAWRDAHEPGVRRALIRSGLEISRVAESWPELWQTAAMHHPWSPPGPVAANPLWPTPHSPIFDFEATTASAGFIDDWARRARQVLAEILGPSGTGEGAIQIVLAHFDWRVEHLRFVTQPGGELALSTAWDWDSLHAAAECFWIGSAANSFTADWSREDVRRRPTLEELRAFLADYELLRGRSFSDVERRASGAALVSAVAYTARCNHAIDPEADLDEVRAQGSWNGDARADLDDIGRAFLG